MALVSCADPVVSVASLRCWSSNPLAASNDALPTVPVTASPAATAIPAGPVDANTPAPAPNAPPTPPPSANDPAAAPMASRPTFGLATRSKLCSFASKFLTSLPNRLYALLLISTLSRKFFNAATCVRKPLVVLPASRAIRLISILACPRCCFVIPPCWLRDCSCRFN